MSFDFRILRNADRASPPVRRDGVSNHNERRGGLDESGRGRGRGRGSGSGAALLWTLMNVCIQMDDDTIHMYKLPT